MPISGTSRWGVEGSSLWMRSAAALAPAVVGAKVMLTVQLLPGATVGDRLGQLAGVTEKRELSVPITARAAVTVSGAKPVLPMVTAMVAGVSRYVGPKSTGSGVGVMVCAARRNGRPSAQAHLTPLSRQ